MIKSFEPFFINGSALELGSFKGEFTKRLLPYFKDITCIEASDEAIKDMKKFDNVIIINSFFHSFPLSLSQVLL